MNKLFLLFILSISSYGAITHINSASGTAITGNPGNSGSIDISGATLLTMEMGSEGGGSVTCADNLGNTWHQLTQYVNNSVGSTLICYAYDKSGSALATGTDYGTVTGYYDGFSFDAWAGTLTSPTNPFDQGNGNTTSCSLTTCQTGSLTPTNANSLVIISLGANFATSITTPATFTTLNNLPFSAAVNFGMGSAYQIQGTATTVNPQWSTTGGSNMAASIASFNAAAGGNSCTPSLAIVGAGVC